MRIKVLSWTEVENGEALSADAVISIRGSTSRAEPELAAALVQATRGESGRQPGRGPDVGSSKPIETARFAFCGIDLMFALTAHNAAID
jgi:hypothetical protein